MSGNIQSSSISLHTLDSEPPLELTPSRPPTPPRPLPPPSVGPGKLNPQSLEADQRARYQLAKAIIKANERPGAAEAASDVEMTDFAAPAQRGQTVDAKAWARELTTKGKAVDRTVDRTLDRTVDRTVDQQPGELIEMDELASPRVQQGKVGSSSTPTGVQKRESAVSLRLKEEAARVSGGSPVDTPPAVAPAQHHHLPDHCVTTLDGAGFALSAGRLYSWNNGTGSWDRMKDKQIVAIRLGADGHAYASTGADKLLRLTGPHPARPLRGSVDAVFCVSPTGYVVSLAPAGAGQQQGRVQVTDPASAGAATTLTLPVPAAEVRALAFGGDGRLHMLSAGGDMFSLQSVPTDGSEQAGWKHLAPPAGVRFASLLTLPNGRLAGSSQDGGNTHMLEKNETWTPLAHDTATGLQRTYGQFRDSRQKITNVTLGSPFTPGAARSDKKGLNWYQSKLAVLAPEQQIQVVPRANEILHTAGVVADQFGRYANYFMAHYLPSDAPARPTQPSPLVQLRQEYAALLALPPTPHPPTLPPSQLDDAIATAIHTNAALALDRIERALGMTDEQGDLKPDWKQSAALRAAQLRPGSTVRPEDNILHTLLQRRHQSMRHGEAGDELVTNTTRRLQRLLDAGVHLQRPLPPRPSREAGFKALPARMFDGAADLAKGIGTPETLGLDILTGQLVKDQLAYETAIQSTDPDRRTTCLDRLTGADDNLIAQRFKQNLWDARSEVAFDAMRSILAGFGQPNHVLNRAARFQGVLGQDKHADYVRLVDELPPGESIRFEYTVGVGLDGDGWSHNWTPADRFKEGAHPKVDKPADLKDKFNIPMNIPPNILPVPSISVEQTLSMTMTKLKDGSLAIAFSKGIAGEVKLLCAKVKWGAGQFGSNHVPDAQGKDSHSALGLVFFGIELVPAALSFGTGKDDSVTLTLRNNDEGVINHVVSQLLSGAITPEELIEITADAAYTRSKYTQWSNTLDVQALVAVVGIFTKPDKLSERLKAVGAFVTQWTGSLNWRKSASQTQDASGISTTTSGYEITTAANIKTIAVTEGQLSYLERLPSASTMRDRAKNIYIGDGYEMEHKVPPWIDLQIMELAAPKAVYQAPTMHQSSDGTITGLKFALTSKDGIDFTKLPHWDELARQSPEIASNLHGAAEKARAQKLPVDIEMELVPERLEMLNIACRRNDATLSKDVRQLMRQPESWRIKQLRVDGREQYSTALVAGASMFRFRSHAGNIHQSHLALIDITYDKRDGGPATLLHAVVRGPLTNGGGQPRFDQLDDLAGTQLGELVYAINEETPDGPRRRLADLPAQGPDANALAELANKWLKAPQHEPHLALDQGRPVLQYRDERPDGNWAHVVLDDADVRRLLQDKSGTGIDPAALLQLMQAGASGQLATPPDKWTALRHTRSAAPRRFPTDPDTGQAHGRPLGIVGLLSDQQNLDEAILRDELDQAQTLVLKTFFPGPHWRRQALDVAGEPAMVAALGHALSQQRQEALADRTAHGMPDVETHLELPPMQTMMGSGAIPSGSAGGGGGGGGGGGA